MYVLDHNRQVALIQEMTQLRKDVQNLVVYYHQPSTNAMWKSYFPKANTYSRGPKILRTEPVPEKIEDRLDDCLKSEEEANAIGLGIELSAEPQRWEEVIRVAEENRRDYNRKQLSLFLKNLEMENYKASAAEVNISSQKGDLKKEDIDALVSRSKWIRFKRFWHL